VQPILSYSPDFRPVLPRRPSASVRFELPLSGGRRQETQDTYDRSNSPPTAEVGNHRLLFAGATTRVETAIVCETEIARQFFDVCVRPNCRAAGAVRASYSH
jgi:hypothetical protein